MPIKTRKTCRVCGSKQLTPILSLGNQFVTNFVDEPEGDYPKGPLELVLCNLKNGGCGLLQLKHTVERDIMYRKYWYRSGISTTMVQALGDITEAVEKITSLKEGDVVVDIGANDGTLLRQYKTSGLVKVGFEPSNLWKLALEGNAKIINDYFNYASFSKVFSDKKAKAITTIAMFYDLEDPNVFVEDIRKCLDKNGIWIIQMNYLGLMIENNTFDNISHEHLEYYSLLSLSYLLERHEMCVFDVELNDVNGGSFRVFVKHKNGYLKTQVGSQRRIQKQKAYERQMGLGDAKVYLDFAKRIERNRQKLLAFMSKEIGNGKRIFIYGASTRGLVVLQYYGIDKKLISGAADMNSDKWGKYIVGTGIPIVSVEEYRRKKPDYLFVLPYHFLEEIKQQEKKFLEDGGKMIVAIPDFAVISKTRTAK